MSMSTGKHDSHCTRVAPDYDRLKYCASHCTRMTPDYEGLNMLATALEWHMTMKDSNNMYAGHCIRMAPDYDRLR